MKVFWITYQLGLLQAWRMPAPWLVALLFFLLSLTLFPLAVGHDWLRQPGEVSAIIWVCALMTSLLNLDAVYREDAKDGTLALWRTSAGELPLMILARMCVHWSLSAWPMMLLLPLVGMMFHLDVATGGRLALSLLLGTPVLSLLAGVLGVVTLHVHHGSALLASLVVPMFLPVLIFGAAGLSHSDAVAHFSVGLMMELAFLLILLPSAPMLAAWLLRNSVGGWGP